MNRDYLTVQETAVELGITEVSVRSALNRNHLSYTMVLGRKAITRTDLNAYKARTQPAGEKKVGRPRKVKAPTE